MKGFAGLSNNKTLKRMDGAMDSMFKPTISTPQHTKRQKRYQHSGFDMFTPTMNVGSTRKPAKRENNSLAPTNDYWK